MCHKTSPYIANRFRMDLGVRRMSFNRYFDIFGGKVEIDHFGCGHCKGFSTLRGLTLTQGVHPPSPLKGGGGGSLPTWCPHTPLPKKIFFNIWSDMGSYRSQMTSWIVFRLGKLLETIWDMIPMILREKIFLVWEGGRPHGVHNPPLPPWGGRGGVPPVLG